jgi:hypothetical protein
MSAIQDASNSSPADDEQRLLDVDKRKLRRRRQAIREVDAELLPPTPTITAFAGDVLPTCSFPLREPLLHRQTSNGDVVVLRAGHIAQVHALRGIGKTWLLMLFALMFSTGGTALGFIVKKRRRVLYIDGEMASEDIRERFQKLSDLTTLPLTDYLEVIGADWQAEYLPRLDTGIGQEAVEEFVQRAEIVFLDNRSCLFDSEGEKDATAWQPAGDYLLSLRRRGKAVAVAHHANRQGGARGHSKAEDPMDLLIKLTRPEDYTADQGARFLVEFEKTRGFHGEAAASFIASLTPNGWITEDVKSDPIKKIRDKAISTLCAIEKACDPFPTSGNTFAKAIGGNRQTALALWAEFVTDGTVIPDGKGGFRLKL